MLQSERVLQARRGRLLCWLQHLGHGWHMTSTKSRCPRIARLQCHNYPDAALTNLTTPAMRPLASATAQDIALTTHWSSSSSMRGNQRKWPQWGRFGNHHRCRHQQHWRYLCRSDRGRYTEKGSVLNTIPRPKKRGEPWPTTSATQN